MPYGYMREACGNTVIATMYVKLWSTLIIVKHGKWPLKHNLLWFCCNVATLLYSMTWSGGEPTAS